MKGFLLSLFAVLGLSMTAQDYTELSLYAWANNKDYYFDLTTTDGDIYTGTGFTLDGATDAAGIYVVTRDWSIQYGCPEGEWYELTTDGTPVDLILGAPNGCWMWDNTIVAADHIWFCVSKAQLVVNQSENSPWGGSGIVGVASDTEVGATYYTIQGVKVENPISGQLYIKKQGSKVSKVVF
ncbi:MAG: hypothetical protein LIP03_06800 [Bacteroidales bacterium]|nr:hypothetical protein [Bacteroidales bacterium]